MPYKDPKKRAACQQRFYRRNKAYYLAKNEEQKQRARAYLVKLKKRAACKYCRESATCCLEFHHTDPRTKSGELANAANYGWSPKRIDEEAAKCEIVCANCHRKLHAGIKLRAPESNRNS